MLSICTITRVTIGATVALMVAVSCTATQTVTPTKATTPTASDMVRAPSLRETTEPFDANEQASTARFATQIAHATWPPDWLGVTPLTAREFTPNGQFATPEALTDRRFVTVGSLPPPPDDTFLATISAVSNDTLARSTWREGCPVSQAELAYLTVSFFGFDHVFHTGELLVNRAVADDVAAVFERLHAARFPIEQISIISQGQLDADPSGDGNITTGFVCRRVVSGTAWSQHAYGQAIDINPFHNPYLRGRTVVPELAGAYLDRDHVRPGMIIEGDAVVAAFADIGWSWGGNWVSAKDWMHFSANGR